MLIAILGGSMFMAGCSSDGAEANYTTEVKLTEEQKAKMAEEAANHPAPGTIDPKTGTSEPGKMTVPGKSK